MTLVYSILRALSNPLHFITSHNMWLTLMLCNDWTLQRFLSHTHTHTALQNNRSHVTKRVPNSGMSRHARRYYERSRAQHVARQARTQAKQRFHELARLRNNPQNPVLMEKGEIQRVGSKLIVLMDYTATQEDELNIEFAETVFADVLKQAGADRIWAYCPRTDRCGFIPVSLVVPPVV